MLCLPVAGRITAGKEAAWIAESGADRIHPFRSDKRDNGVSRIKRRDACRRVDDEAYRYVGGGTGRFDVGGTPDCFRKE